MESLRKFGLLDADGKPLDDRLQQGPQRSAPTVPETLSRDPGRRGGHRGVRGGGAAHHETRTSSPDRSRSFGGYAWKALESIGVSTAAARLDADSVQHASSPGPDPRSCPSLRAWDGSVEEIERGILLRELEAHMTAGRGVDLPPEGARLLERGHREAPRQLGELGRQGDEPLEAKNSRADGGEGVENSWQSTGRSRHLTNFVALATSTDTEIADDERRSAP